MIANDPEDRFKAWEQARTGWALLLALGLACRFVSGKVLHDVLM